MTKECLGAITYLESIGCRVLYPRPDSKSKSEPNDCSRSAETNNVVPGASDTAENIVQDSD